MRKATSKKMTIDDLAVMVAKGFDGVNTRFNGVEKRLDEVDKRLNEVEKGIDEVKENLASTRRDVFALGDRFTLKYEFHDLANRVSVLEQKQKVKR